jgi:hypothetical protein
MDKLLQPPEESVAVSKSDRATDALGTSAFGAAARRAVSDSICRRHRLCRADRQHRFVRRPYVSGRTERGYPGRDLGDADRKLRRRYMDCAGNVSAAAFRGDRLANRHRSHLTERDDRRPHHRGWRQPAGRCAGYHAGFRCGDVCLRCAALHSRRLPSRILFPFCALKRRRRLSVRNRIFSAGRRHTNDDWTCHHARRSHGTLEYARDN